ncbi:MAG: glycogen synthase GlgA [Selenomonadales bacterium]|nr:glycogen synthase GlgA [Selenomonadales bacterium]
MLKVLYVTSEAVPFAKTGGLADVAGSLPKELRAKGIDARVVMPKYGKIKEEYTSRMELVYEGNTHLGWRKPYCGVLTLEQDGVPFYFVDNEYYFHRDEFYGHDDDAERFAFFCRVVLDMLPQIDFVPDVIHLNDWHTGPISVLYHSDYAWQDMYRGIKTVFTIHNLKYQGVFSKDAFTDLLELDWKWFDGMSFYDSVNYMKAGLVYSDYITTVSRTYAHEIQNAYYGEQLDGILRMRSDRLVGIVNGIDYSVYNPATDARIFKNYDVNSIEVKRENKQKLQELCGLPQRNVPILAMVTRLVEAKGLDLVTYIIDELLAAEDVQLVIVGTGDKKYEEFFRSLAWKYPTKVSANILFDETLAHRVYAGSDIFLMPSQYEPCGIGQLIALRYGTLPVVRKTGGLNDTVTPYNKYTGEGNGFEFGNYNAHELLYTIKWALGLYYDTSVWEKLVQNAMNCDFSWNYSAEEYIDLYQTMAE